MAFREKKDNLASEKNTGGGHGDAEFNRGTQREQPCSDEKTHWGTFFEVGEQISGLSRHTLKNDLPVARGWFTVKNNKTILFLCCSPSTEASNFAVVGIWIKTTRAPPTSKVRSLCSCRNVAKRELHHTSEK